VRKIDAGLEMGLSREEASVVYQRYRAFSFGLSLESLYKNLTKKQKCFLEWLFDNE